jgi:hypothetical protein
MPAGCYRRFFERSLSIDPAAMDELKFCLQAGWTVFLRAERMHFGKKQRNQFPVDADIQVSPQFKDRGKIGA